MRYAKWIRCSLAALINGNIMTRFVAEVDLARPRNFLLGIEEHLFPLRDPTGSARNREQDWKHRHWETHRLIYEPGVEVHVGIKLALHEVFVFQGDPFAFQSDFEQWVFPHQIENFVGNTLDDAGARIIILVNAMTEAH